MGLTDVATRSPRPLSTCLITASASTARFTAWRTRRSVKGFGPPRPAWSSCSMAVLKMGEVPVRAWPDLLMTSIWSGGTALMMSTPPEISSAIWVAVSGMMRMRLLLVPLDELVGPCANRVLLHPLVAFLLYLLLGLHHLGGQALHEERIGAVGLEVNGGLVHHLDALDLGVVAAGDHLLLGVEHPVEGGLDVAGGEGGAVVELDALAELDLPGRVFERFPGQGQARPHLARLGVARGQVIEDVVAEDDGFPEHRVGRVPAIDVRLQRVDDGIVLGLSLEPRGRGQGEGEQGGDCQCGGTTHNVLLLSVE